MARRNKNLLYVLMRLPWWVSVIVAGVVYLLLGFIVPSLSSDSIFLQSIGMMFQSIAPIFALIFLLPAPIAAWNSYQKRKRLDNQNNVESIRALSWKEFEELVAEAYRRQGYKVIENDTVGADGGIDIRLKKNGQIHIVQCKNWRSQKVGVSIIREMYGLMVSEEASSAIVVCSGIFTQEAKNFAANKPLDLVTGAQLMELVGQVKRSKEKTTPEKTESHPKCPHCRNTLVPRTAMKGANAGNKFYGCSSYPKCHYTQSYNS